MPKSKGLSLTKKSLSLRPLSPSRGPGAGREAEGAGAAVQGGSLPVSAFINFAQGGSARPPRPAPSLQRQDAGRRRLPPAPACRGRGPGLCLTNRPAEGRPYLVGPRQRVESWNSLLGKGKAPSRPTPPSTEMWA